MQSYKRGTMGSEYDRREGAKDKTTARVEFLVRQIERIAEETTPNTRAHWIAIRALEAGSYQLPNKENSLESL